MKEAAKQRRKYFKQIDVIGAEDTFYFGNKSENNKLDPQLETVELLGEFVAAGLPVLAIDYLTDAAKIADFVARALAQGFVPYVSVRDLDELTIPHGYEPTCG